MPVETDRRLAELGVQAELRDQLRSYRAVLESGLTPDAMLQRITEIAVEISGAEFGAIGITGSDGGLEQFITVGLPEAVQQHIGAPPKGLGLLGALIEEQEPLVLDDLTADQRHGVFPPGHPPMRSFLGAPILLRGGAYANFYLTHSQPGMFTAAHLDALVALSSTVSLAIEVALGTVRAEAQARWNEAMVDITEAMLAADDERSLGILADHVRDLVDADAVCILTPIADDSFVITVARGEGETQALGAVLERQGSLAGQVFESGQPIATTGGGRGNVLGWDPVAVVPLSSGGTSVGVLVAARLAGRRTFSQTELATVADFAGQASIALVLIAARQAGQQLTLLEDRARIARDLHDHVIQRLFGAGLALQAVSGRISDPAARSEVGRQIDALDAAIKEIRTAIFAMTQEGGDRPSLRHRIIDCVGEAAAGLDAPPLLSFAGAVDLLVPAELAEDVLAVVREGLTNVAKHAGGPSQVEVQVSAGEDEIRVVIADDGIGLPATPTRRSGTGNLAGRAAAWGGAFALRTAADGGTELTWTARYAGKETR